MSWAGIWEGAAWGRTWEETQGERLIVANSEQKRGMCATKKRNEEVYCIKTTSSE